MNGIYVERAWQWVISYFPKMACVRSWKIPIRLIENRRIRLMSRMERFRIFWTRNSAYLPFHHLLTWPPSFLLFAHEPFLILNVLLSLANKFCAQIHTKRLAKKLKVSIITYYLAYTIYTISTWMLEILNIYYAIHALWIIAQFIKS